MEIISTSSVSIPTTILTGLLGAGTRLINRILDPTVILFDRFAELK